MHKNCGILGTFLLQNEIQTQPIPNIKKKDYLLGNGIDTRDPLTATDEFLRREFPEILNCRSVPHSARFATDAFIYKKLGTKVSLSSKSTNKCFISQPRVVNWGRLAWFYAKNIQYKRPQIFLDLR